MRRQRRVQEATMTKFAKMSWNRWLEIACAGRVGGVGVDFLRTMQTVNHQLG